MAAISRATWTKAAHACLQISSMANRPAAYRQLFSAVWRRGRGARLGKYSQIAHRGARINQRGNRPPLTARQQEAENHPHRSAQPHRFPWIVFHIDSA